MVDMSMEGWNPNKKHVINMGRLLNLLCNKIEEIQIDHEYGIKEFFAFFPNLLNQIKVHNIEWFGKYEIPILMEWLANSTGNDNAKQKCIKIDASLEKYERKLIEQIIEVFYQFLMKKYNTI